MVVSLVNESVHWCGKLISYLETCDESHCLQPYTPPFPPAFAIASPSPERGEAMAKAGGKNPPVEPELSILLLRSRDLSGFICK
jgi:hypothetical protein